MTITRRSFLKGLMATSALVAVPGAAVATVSNHDKIMALVERKMAEAQRRILVKTVSGSSFILEAALDQYPGAR